ncbi:unnamed protein product [Medioppia subpectinata]|uniref:C2H2-type domain-containing protein n=1 Tax=Medioppia subpectinata TaxID=1979941 RepID=A0A7R9PVE6_9ACAR|nr:unnamed protein product [Medioppia subpectinata]CAG2102553.1 unnamed protein product [Medioppia subpectinata]
MDSCIVLNDILDELRTELSRVSRELRFANQCIESLFEFKHVLDAICRRFGQTFDTKLAKTLNDLNSKHESLLQSVRKETPSVVARRKQYSFECRFVGCGFRTNRNSRLVAHSNRHSGERPFACAQCPKSFVGREALTNHCRVVHQRTALRCVAAECARRARRRAQRPLAAEPKTEFLCSKCDYKSKTRQALNQHKVVHNERTMKCDFCPKLFKSRKQLKCHAISHQLEPQFKCDRETCGAAFRTRKTLRNHLLKHANACAAHACLWPGCDFRAHEEWLLRRHLCVHSQEKPFSCSECEQQFRRKHALNAHVRRRHAIT